MWPGLYPLPVPTEVRSASLDALSVLAEGSELYANQCLDFLVDMFNDEIEDVRLKAVQVSLSFDCHLLYLEIYCISYCSYIGWKLFIRIFSVILKFVASSSLYLRQTCLILSIIHSKSLSLSIFLCIETSYSHPVKVKNHWSILSLDALVSFLFSVLLTSPLNYACSKIFLNLGHTWCKCS